MFQLITTIIKWASLPMLLVAAMFSRFAGSYGLLLDGVICLGAIVLVQRAVWARKYIWAIGFVALGVVFSPLMLGLKVFIFVGVACIAPFITLIAAWRMQPIPAV